MLLMIDITVLVDRLTYERRSADGEFVRYEKQLLQVLLLAILAELRHPI